MKILLVEDEHNIAAAIKKGLVQERYAVDVAYDGTEGLDLAISEQYDCILLDLMLPGIDGMSICKELRAHQNHTPILILTARGETQDKIKGLNAGADDYLTKPFSFEELLARIRALTRRPSTVINSLLSIESLTLNPRSFSVQREKTDIRLSHKEFELLEYMMRHPHTILTKDDIISHVWDFEANILPNTVEVYIKNLRTKIDAPFTKKTPLIQTIRGFGYKLGT